MAEEIAQEKHHGFIIYRTDYTDDAQFERYMAYLKHQTRCGLESEDKIQLYPCYDWKVMSSPDMQDEGPEDIYKRFINWLESGEEKIDFNNYRYRACILVDEAALMCLDSFMENKSLETDDDLTLFDYRGYTFGVVISKYKEEGWTMVGMSFLMPRAGDILMMDGECRGWKEIAVPEGDICVGF